MSIKITFFIARYSRSGVPLAQIRLAKALHRRGHEVEFVIGYVPDDLSVPVIEGIKVINLNIPRTYKLLLPILSYTKKNQPDVIFTAEDHLNAVVTFAVILAKSKAKLIASSRVTPYDTYSDKLFSKKWVLKQLSILLRKRVDALVCVSKDMVKQYEAIFGPSKYECIYNLVVDSDLDLNSRESVDHPWFSERVVPIVISAGRLAPEKGFTDLITAMKLVNNSIHARLVIIGDGPLKSELQGLIENLNLTDRVQLLGFQSNPYKFFARSQLFVLSSYVEGLPNVLVEAMACGCNIVSTDCPTGPREVLMDGQFGELVPVRSPQLMANAIVRSLSTQQDPKKLKTAIYPFTEEQVLTTYQRILGI